MTGVAKVLVRAAVEQWLRSLPPDAAVGDAGCAEDCPLARYLQSRGRREVEVEGGAHWYDARGIHRLPVWAAQFVDALDEAYAAGSDTQPVTAAEALAVLLFLEPAEEVMA